MTESDLPERLYASLPAEDPRFTELRALLATVSRSGRTSPVPRILGEWALLGFLMQSGKLPTSSAGERLPLPGDGLSSEAAARQRKEVEQVLDGAGWNFD